MRIFLSLSLFLIFWGCSPVEKSSLVKSGSSGVKPTGWESPFQGFFEKSLFRTTLDIRDYHLTGYTLIKKSADTSIRIVFANDMGMTLYDVEFVREKFIIHYVFEPMKKNALLSILESDFRALFFYTVEAQGLTNYTEKASGIPLVYQPRDKRYYYYDPKTLHITAIAGGSNRWNNFRITFDYPKGTFVQNILITNPGIKLSLRLGWISQ